MTEVNRAGLSAVADPAELDAVTGGGDWSAVSNAEAAGIGTGIEAVVTLGHALKLS